MAGRIALRNSQDILIRDRGARGQSRGGVTV
jgi:hypothetical protein